MSIEAMQLALEALEEWDKSMSKGSLEAHRILRTAIAAAEKQEPVATVRCIHGVTIGYLEIMQPVGTKLYTTPPAAPVQEPVGNWVWSWLMDWCKRNGIAPATRDSLFAMVKDARSKFDTTPPPAQPAPNDIELMKCWVEKLDGTIDGIASMRLALSKYGAAQRQPLTDEEMRVIENKINPNMRWRSSDEEGITLYPSEYYELVRAIEAAHGIKENT